MKNILSSSFWEQRKYISIKKLGPASIDGNNNGYLYMYIVIIWTLKPNIKPISSKVRRPSYSVKSQVHLQRGPYLRRVDQTSRKTIVTFRAVTSVVHVGYGAVWLSYDNCTQLIYYGTCTKGFLKGCLSLKGCSITIKMLDTKTFKIDIISISPYLITNDHTKNVSRGPTRLLMSNCEDVRINMKKSGSIPKTYIWGI